MSKVSIITVANKLINDFRNRQAVKNQIIRTECINRDYNATINMLYIIEFLLKYKKRPPEFERPKKVASKVASKVALKNKLIASKYCRI